MKTWTSRIILGGIVMLALALLVGGMGFTTAYAQGPSQGGDPPGTFFSNQAVLDLLNTTQDDLYDLRQEGKSWLDIATSKGVTEAALIAALLEPMNARHAWMAENYPQFDVTERAELMQKQFVEDIRLTEFGTLTDRHVFGRGGMLANGNCLYGFGSMRGGGMMGNWNNVDDLPGRRGFGNWNNFEGFRGMMRGGGMHGWNFNPNVTPIPAQ